MGLIEDSLHRIMLEFITVTSIESFVQENLMFVAIGHIGLVLILLVFFFNMGKNDSIVEPTEKDEDTFVYDEETSSMFKSNSNGESRIEIPSDDEKPPSDDTSESDIDEPIVFNSQINEADIPNVDNIVVNNNEEEEEAEEVEDKAEEETENNPPQESAEIEQKRLDRITEILSSKSERGIFVINRDEIILDLNSQASELFQFTQEDLSGKKVDEIIFLEESEKENGEVTDQQQSAHGQKKDGERFPISVELEMADREFGLITVTLFPAMEPEMPSAENETVEDPVELPEEKTEPEPEEIKAVPVAMPPPPPPPKARAITKPLAPIVPLSTALVANAKSLDSKTVEMFSTQLAQPLQSIVQLAELISNDANAIPHLKKYAVAIQAKSNRMMSQIDEMSMLVSAQKGQIQLQDKPFNLSKVMANLVDIAASVTSDQEQNIHYSPEEQDLIVLSDEEHFQKVVSNLIDITLHTADEKDISLLLKSELISENKDPGKKISFDGQELLIGSTRRIFVSTEFPSDPNTNRFFDISINRTEDNSIVNRLQSSGSLKNYNSSIRLMKELVRGLGGKLAFVADEENKGIINFSVELQCAQVGSYPS